MRFFKTQIQTQKHKNTKTQNNMYTLTIQNKTKQQTTLFTYTTQDMQTLELQLNVLRDALNMPDFEELQDGSFISENNTHRFLLEETHTNTTHNENTYL